MRARGAAWQTVSRGGQAYRWLELPTPHYALGVYEPLAPGSPTRPSAAFIHGLEEGWEIWEPLAARLSGSLRSFCLDLPWSGRSSYGWAHETSVTEWIARGLSPIPAPVSIVVAHSFGANAFLEFVHTHGLGSLEAAILISPFYRGQQAFPWPLFHHYMDNFQRFLEAGVQVRRSALRAPPGSDSAVARKLFDRIGPMGCLQFLNLFSRTPRLELGRLRVRVLIVGGEEDFYSLPADCEALRRALPRAEAHLLSGCGHFGMVEQPQTLASLIEDFLSRSPRSGLGDRREDEPCPLA